MNKLILMSRLAQSAQLVQSRNCSRVAMTYASLLVFINIPIPAT